ncbi:transcription factor domain-containing protein [Aspergillus mulundensis]|uniref:Putative Zn(II)2Cys6 transcription factor n=1 Tax=Aspergillus mulundensis TaxID=1810919 RepID=A0A3D8RL30_9EURO|nr:putative Zn(II)2Cys6 transcription factor [Aspergillus mulundensis]RDW74660.1 putative Zn(II)2Cys6 transcription factor [Aspergillus mulundensis]
MKCRLVGCADECRYPARDRQVKVSESYLEQILAEIQRLRAQSASSANTPEARPGPEADHTRLGPDGQDEAGNENDNSTSVRNPIIGDRAWFHAYDPSAPPIFVGEAACTAFATRFRQFLTGSNATAHIRRTQYVKEENIALANAGEIRWPSLQQARLLVKIAIRQISCVYHVLLRKSTLDKLEEIYRTGDFECTVNQCKFFALFAFGEAYSMRSEPASGSRVPGTSYFARSLSLVQVLPERTSITHLETLLLLSLFSYYLNRRHSAYVLIGSAMRLGLCIGLNHNIPESQLIDPVERQHRVRIWWTIYIFDRMWASKMGLPSQILDDDIHLDMPSSTLPNQTYDEQFTDVEFLKANINLARIVGETTAKVYSRRKYNETFLQRVQKLLKALKNWVDTLPEHLRLNVDDPEMNTKQVTSIHLAFNQCVILTTRPTLLHLLKLTETSTTSSPNPPQETVSQPLQTLGEACIHAARHSHSIILTKWINGSLPVFGYFHAHYLFSASLVLAMSAFVPLPLGSPADLNAFETSLEVLANMSENGNLAASEFYHNLQSVRGCLDPWRADRGVASRCTSRNGGGQSQSRGPFGAAAGPSAPLTPSTPSERPAGYEQTSVPATVAGSVPNLLSTYNQPNFNYSHTPTITTTLPEQGPSQIPDRTAGGFTTAMAFMEPTMQDFLAQSDLDLGLLNPVETFMDHVEGLYSGHEFSFYLLY